MSKKSTGTKKKSTSEDVTKTSVSCFQSTSNPCEKFLLDYKIRPGKYGGTESYNYTYKDDSGKIHLINMPTERITQLHSLIVQNPLIDLSEHIDSTNFVVFFDWDCSLNKFIKNKFHDIYSGQTAVDYFTKRKDYFISTARKLFLEFKDDLDTQSIVLRRVCCRYHIIFPNIRSNQPSMKIFIEKLLKELKEHEDDFFKWSNIIDTQPYSNALRMVGTRKAIADDENADEAKLHQIVFQGVDRYSDTYYLDPSDTKEKCVVPLSTGLLDYCSLHCYHPDKVEPNLVIVSYEKDSENSIVNEAFNEHTEKLLKEKVSEAIWSLNSLGPLNSGFKMNVDSTITNWKKLPPKEHAQYDKTSAILQKSCYLADLIKQKCPFKGGMHKRRSSTLYCIIFEDNVQLRCHDCTKLDDKAKLRQPITPKPEEIDFLMQSELAANALFQRTHSTLASVIFNWIKDRVAASEIKKKDGKASYTWYYYVPQLHIWERGDDRIVEDVMDANGIVQTKFKEIVNGVIESFREQKNDKKKEKEKTFRMCYSKLIKILQQSAIQGTVIPLIARKVAAYYKNKDPNRRSFEDQLDKKPWLMATLSGVIDFQQNGKLRPGKASDLLSISIQNPYTPWDHLDARSRNETWNYFKDIFPVETEMNAALWSFARSLNGANRRQCMYFCEGKGGDGKSVLFGKIFPEMLRGMLKNGDKATIFGNDENSGGAARADLVHMKNARMFIFSEYGAKDILNNPRFKQITGGERMNARGMYATDPDEIELQATYFLPGNYRVRIDALFNDDSIWRRVRIIYFRRRYRSSEAEMTGEEYEKIGLSDGQIRPLVERLSKTVLSLLVHIYEKTSHITEWPEPELWTQMREEMRYENDVWLKFIRECTRTIEHDEKGTSLRALYVAFTTWLKSRGNGRKAHNIEKFREYLTSYLKEPILLENGEKGWLLEIKAEMVGSGGGDQVTFQSNE